MNRIVTEGHFIVSKSYLTGDEMVLPIMYESNERGQIGIDDLVRHYSHAPGIDCKGQCRNTYRVARFLLSSLSNLKGSIMSQRVTLDAYLIIGTRRGKAAGHAVFPLLFQTMDAALEGLHKLCKQHALDGPDGPPDMSPHRIERFVFFSEGTS